MHEQLNSFLVGMIVGGVFESVADQPSLNIDWPNVDAREACLFSFAFGAGLMFLACWALYSFLRDRLHKIAAEECDLANEGGYRRGLNDGRAQGIRIAAAATVKEIESRPWKTLRKPQQP